MCNRNGWMRHASATPGGQPGGRSGPAAQSTGAGPARSGRMACQAAGFRAATLVAGAEGVCVRHGFSLTPLRIAALAADSEWVRGQRLAPGGPCLAHRRGHGFPHAHPCRASDQGRGAVFPPFMQGLTQTHSDAATEVADRSREMSPECACPEGRAGSGCVLC